MADVEEIHHIKSLPHHIEYDKVASTKMSDLVVMSMTPQERMRTALDKKLYLIRRLREKIIFRMKAAEDQFIQLKRELDYTYRVLDEQPLEELVQHYHPKDSPLRKEDMPERGIPLSLQMRMQGVHNFIHTRKSPVKEGGGKTEMPTMLDKPLGQTPNEVITDQKV